MNVRHFVPMTVLDSVNPEHLVQIDWTSPSETHPTEIEDEVITIITTSLVTL